MSCLRLPGWWEDHLCIAKGDVDEVTGLLLLNIRNTERGAFYFSDSVVLDTEEEIEVRIAGSIFDVEAIDDDFLFRSKAFSFRLARPQSGTYVSARPFGTSNCLVLVHSDLPIGKLLSIDIAKGNVLWEQELWCDMAPYVRSGGGFFHWSEMQVRDDAVFVFGLCNDVAYIQAFELMNGNSVFRFSTTFGWSMANAMESHRRTRREP